MIKTGGTNIMALATAPGGLGACLRAKPDPGLAANMGAVSAHASIGTAALARRP